MARPKLTKELFHESLKPPNNCKVKALLDSMDEESRAILEEALAVDKKEYPASNIIDLLKAGGWNEADLPGTDAISCHRQGRRPCRCRS